MLGIKTFSLRFGALALLAALSFCAGAADEERGKEIYGPCAGCHGEFGAGGKKGEYPRIAGQSAKYIAQQLKAFQKRVRVNIPMVPYTEERELSDADMKTVAEFLAQIELPTKMPVFKGNEDALVRLQAVDKVMIVPRVEGDIDNGGAVYKKNCVACHGKTGKGRGMFPMIAGQYTNYLKKQIAAFLRGERAHDEDEIKEGVLFALKEKDIQDVLAYLTSIQDQE